MDENGGPSSRGEITHAKKDDAHLSMAYLLTVEEEKSLGIPSVNHCIPRVPYKLRHDNARKYDPRVISIGPYHRDKPGLQVTQNHKKKFLKSFIGRTTRAANDILKEMDDKIAEVQDEARKCYSDKIDLDDGKFREMLILDGCYILELFKKYEDNSLGDDILLKQDWVISSLRTDLVLLENQIPFVVLSHLFNLTYDPPKPISDPGSSTPSRVHIPVKLIPMKLMRSCCNQELESENPSPSEAVSSTRTGSLNKLIIEFFSCILPEMKIQSDLEVYHLLDLLRNHLVQGRRISEGDTTSWERTICATELEEVGVKFKRKDVNSGLLDITFEDGEFNIPPFYFGKLWTSLFPNMIAWEQCGGGYKITSYAILIDDLINTEKDVKLFRKKGIIDGSAVEDETVAYDVNHLCKDAFYDQFDYDGLCNDVNKYTKKVRHKLGADLKRNYCNTVWGKISVAAATFLLLLTLIQTICTIIQTAK